MFFAMIQIIARCQRSACYVAVPEKRRSGHGIPARVFTQGAQAGFKAGAGVSLVWMCHLKVNRPEKCETAEAVLLGWS